MKSKEETRMKRILIVLFALTLMCCFVAACHAPERTVETIASEEATTCQEPEPTLETLSPGEVSRLKNTHPDCFGLDTTEGLHVLAYEVRKGEFEFRLVSGNKDHFTWEEAMKSTYYRSLTLEELKKMLLFYHLPDEKIHLHPWRDPMCNYMVPIDDSYIRRLSEFIDNRFDVEEQWREEQY